jgi:hypothetical protein
MDSETGVWTNYYQFLYSYTNGLMDTSLLQNWNNQTNIWFDNIKTITTYDSEERIYTRTQLSHDIYTQQLLFDHRFIYNYEDGNETEIYQTYTKPDGPWKNDWRIYTSYIQDEFVDTIQGDSWDYINQQWVGDYRTVNGYDNRMLINESKEDYFYNDIWETYVKTDYYWSPFVLNSIVDDMVEFAKIYPNPATSHITFSGGQHGQKILRIYSLTGKILSEIIFDSKSLDLNCESYLPGMYIYSIESNGLTQTGKLIIR